MYFDINKQDQRLWSFGISYILVANNKKTIIQTEPSEMWKFLECNTLDSRHSICWGFVRPLPQEIELYRVRKNFPICNFELVACYKPKLSTWGFLKLEEIF